MEGAGAVGQVDLLGLGALGQVDLLGLGALGQVAAEWLALGTLSGLDWPAAPGRPTFWAARWALRLLIGAILLALAQLFLTLVGIGFGFIPLVLIVAALFAGALRLTGRVDKTAQPIRMDTRERAGWLLLAAVLVVATLRALLVPEGGWDAYSHWGLRAQAYALAGTVVDAHSEHEYYPPLVPFLEAWLYLHRGGVAIDLGKTIWALVGSAFTICLAWSLRLSLRVPWQAPYLAAAIVLTTTALLDGFWTGQADLALTVYLTLATLAVWHWQRAPHRRWLVLAGLFAAAAALTKLEGFPRIGIVAAALIAETLRCRSLKNVPPALVLVGSSGAALLAWTVIALAHGIAPNTEHLGPFQPLAIGTVLVSLLGAFGGVRTGGGVLIAVLGAVVAARQLPRLLVLVVLGELVATLLAFLFSATSPAIEVRTSASRLVEQFLPLALVAVALGLSRQTYTYNRRGR